MSPSQTPESTIESPRAYPDGRRETRPEPKVRLNKIPVGEPDDSLSKEQFQEVLGY